MVEVDHATRADLIDSTELSSPLPVQAQDWRCVGSSLPRLQWLHWACRWAKALVST